MNFNLEIPDINKNIEKPWNNIYNFILDLLILKFILGFYSHKKKIYFSSNNLYIFKDFFF